MIIESLDDEYEDQTDVKPVFKKRNMRTSATVEMSSRIEDSKNLVHPNSNDDLERDFEKILEKWTNLETGEE